MVNHSTVSEFEDSWAKLQEKWNETASGRDVIEYLTNEYIHKKEKFVRAYTNHNLHLGNVASSPVEGAHAALKKCLGGSTGNLYIVFESMKAKLKEKHIAASKKLSDELQLVPNWLNIPLFEQVVKKISSYALGKVYEQYLKFQRYHQSKEELPACTKYHQYALRLPCVHTLQNQLPRACVHIEQPTAFKDIILELSQLQITDFASHWWLQKTSIQLILLPPIETNNGANTFTQNLNISQVGPGVASSNQILLDRTLSCIGSQFNKLPTHQQIAMLGQVVGMAEDDPATSKAVL